MKRSEFVKIMDHAIKKSKNHPNGWYTCVSIRRGIQNLTSIYDANIWEDMIDIYAKTFRVNKITFEEQLQDYTDLQLKNTRLAALELFKEMMLATKEYKNIEL